MRFLIPKFCYQYATTSLIFSFLLSSCASHKYSQSERGSNQTVQYYVNAENTTVRLLGASQTIGNNFSTSMYGSNGTSGKLVLPNMKKNSLTLVFEAPDYNPDTIQLERQIRSEAFYKSLALSLFLFGTPLLIDVFRSDFYELKPANVGEGKEGSRFIKVELKYSYAFYRRTLDVISEKTEPTYFQRYILLYPESPFIEEAILLKDKSEFKIALEKGTEDGLDEFIRTHQDSEILPEALNAKAEMEKARMAFEKARKENTEEAYSVFLVNFPSSIHTEDAIVERTKAAYERLVVPTDVTSEQVLEFLNTYLIPSSLLMPSGWVKVALEMSISRFVNSSKKELKGQGLSEIEVNSQLLTRIHNLESTYQNRILSPDIGDFYSIETELYKKNIEDWTLDYFYHRGVGTQNEGGWEKSVYQIVKYFPSICHLEKCFCFEKLLNSQLNKDSDIILANSEWVFDYFNEMWEGDALKDFTSFQMNGEYQYLENHADWLKLTYKNNYLIRLETRKNSSTTCVLSFRGESNRSSDIESAEYFNNGKLVGKKGLTNGQNESLKENMFYYYEFVNGENITLNNHPAVLNAQTLMNSNPSNYKESINDVRNAKTEMLRMFNYYPVEDVKAIPEWSELMNSLDNKISAYEADLEKERLKREQEEAARRAATPFWHGEIFTNWAVDYMGTTSRQIEFSFDGKSGEYTERNTGAIRGGVTMRFNVISSNSDGLTMRITSVSDPGMSEVVGETQQIVINSDKRSLKWGNRNFE